MATIVTRFKFRRGTAAAWTSANPTLMEGEAGYETDTGSLKIGDGSTAWNSLAYFSTGAVGDLDDLTDVVITSPSTGEVLQFDGANWVNAPSSGGSPATDTMVWMPLTTVVGGVPDLVWDADDSLIPTLIPI